MRYWVVLVPLLAGCVSPAEQARREEYERQQVREYRMRAMEARCYELGFKPGAPDFRQCLLTLESNYRQQDAQDRAVILQHMLRQQRR